MENKSNRLFTEEESRMSTRRWLYIITCWILILIFIVFGGHTGDDESIPMKKIGADGVQIDSDQHGDGRISVDTNPACWTDNTTVEVNNAPERVVEEIPQPKPEEVFAAYEEYVTPESPAEEETAEVEEPEVVETSDAGTVVVAEETGDYKESNPQTDTFVGDGSVVGGEPDPSNAE